MMVLGKFYAFCEKTPQAQKAQNAHKEIKTKIILNAHKNIYEEESCLFGIKRIKRTLANKKDNIFVHIKRLRRSV